MSKRRIVVTGMGIVSPVGSTIESAWNNIKAGRSGIRRIPESYFDASESTVQIAGTVQGFNADDYLSPKEQRKMDPFIHYGMAAGMQAVREAGLDNVETNNDRIGVCIGAGIGGIHTIEENTKTYVNRGQRKISPFFVPSSIINMVSGNLSIMYNFQGPNLALVTACTTATHSIGIAARTIAYGDADVMIAGGAEFATTPLGIGGFAAARALSTRNDDPESASRPWDVDRDGFVLGDGSGVLVLEELEHAKARGANIICELAGFGMSGDAHHMTQPSLGGEGAARCMDNALRDAGINHDEVQYINAHGTSTPAGDKAETMAVKRSFGDLANSVAVSSTKSMTGHLLGAAGGIEAVFTALAVRDQILPPTINIDNQDPECDLDFVPNVARETEVKVAISNSFGFGGTNGTVVFKKF